MLNLHGLYGAYKRVFTGEMWPAADHEFNAGEQFATYGSLIINCMAVQFPLMLLVFQLTKFAIGESVLYVSWKIDVCFALSHVVYVSFWFQLSKLLFPTSDGRTPAVYRLGAFVFFVVVEGTYIRKILGGGKRTGGYATGEEMRMGVIMMF